MLLPKNHIATVFSYFEQFRKASSIFTNTFYNAFFFFQLKIIAHNIFNIK